jgi:hypothetical protein
MRLSAPNQSEFDERIDALVGAVIWEVADIASKAIDAASIGEAPSLSMTNVLDALARLQSVAKAGA